MLESQINYALQAIALLRRGDVKALDVRPAVQRAYNEDIARRLSATVWNAGGCASWYLDANGLNTSLWPDFSFRFAQAMRRFDPAELAPARTREEVLA